MCEFKNNEVYNGLTPVEALQKLNKRYIRKPECKRMLEEVTEYIKQLENDAHLHSFDNNIEKLCSRMDILSQNIGSIENTLNELETP